jgi:hypothetical protein
MGVTVLDMAILGFGVGKLDSYAYQWRSIDHTYIYVHKFDSCSQYT